jgi:2,4-dienoyl-CoA reductase-like NADH-dependent reductase (Old Yellow Enzyme family)
MTTLFQPITLRDLTLTNRLIVSPMCQYSSVDGFATDWHLVHLGSRAVGGASLVFTEASAVTADGRISPQDLGIWSDRHIDALSRITAFLHSQGSAAGVQLAHAGRKGSTLAPWFGDAAVPEGQGGWQPVAPTPQPFSDTYPVPRALTRAEIAGVVDAFEAAARRALDAEFDVVEIHAAHGYLIHQFLSPLVNDRTDDYGGSFDNRVRLCLDVADVVRRAWPERLPVFVRISSTDWVEGGWDIEQSVELARRLRDRGIDLIDCSSGGAVKNAKIPVGPGYQVPFAERIRREAGIATAAVGMITSARQAEDIVSSGQADMVLMARQFLRDPYAAAHFADDLGAPFSWPVQYTRAAPQGSTKRSAR